MIPYTQHRFSTPSHQSGAAAVEFAIIMFVLFLVGAGMVEFGRAFWYYNAIAKGTRDAARYLSAIPTANLPAAAATAQDIVVRTAASGGVPGFSAAHVSVACAPTACAMASLPTDINRVTVTAQYGMGIGVLFPFIAPAGGSASGFAVTLVPHTTMPYLW